MTHFWPDYTALIAELREIAAIRSSVSGPDELIHSVLNRAADAMEAERKVRIEEYAIAKHLRVEALAAKERAEVERDAIKSSYEQAAFNLLADLSEQREMKEIAEAERDKAREWSRLRNEDIMTLGQEVGGLSEALQECADELEALVRDRYAGTQQYPSKSRRYERDMEPVRRARALLSHPTTEPDL